jgi:hypothetical protein
MLMETTILLAKSTSEDQVFLRTIVIIGTLISGNPNLKSIPIFSDMKTLLQRQGTPELQQALAIVQSLLK